MKSKEMLAFEDWLYENNTPGSNKAGSYVTVIEYCELRKLPSDEIYRGLVNFVMRSLI